MAFPRPPLNDVKQDDTVMHYVRNGDFSQSDIGARKSGTPGSMADEGATMSISHVGNKFGSR